jgi:hypothetical protein
MSKNVKSLLNKVKTLRKLSDTLKISDNLLFVEGYLLDVLKEYKKINNSFSYVVKVSENHKTDDGYRIMFEDIQYTIANNTFTFPSLEKLTKEEAAKKVFNNEVLFINGDFKQEDEVDFEEVIEENEIEEVYLLKPQIDDFKNFNKKEKYIFLQDKIEDLILYLKHPKFHEIPFQPGDMLDLYFMQIMVNLKELVYKLNNK